jgi:nitroreductase
VTASLLGGPVRSAVGQGVDFAVFQVEPDEARPPPRPRATAAQACIELMRSRRQTSPKRLVDPGPPDEQIHALFDAAAQAPDHGRIRPWRFVHVGAGARRELGEAFARALRERDPDATPAQVQDARVKALRAPFLALAIVRLDDGRTDIPSAERLVSLGCALQNMLLAAHAFGWGAGLVSGQAMRATALRELFGIGADEQAVCFLAIGTVSGDKPPRERPAPEDFVSQL